jgi:RNA polymerase sigma-70 factor (ECF subfamily)
VINRPDIHELLGMIADEDRLAFNIFYEMYYDQAFRYAYYFLKDVDHCREVVSNLFFAVWQSRKKLRDIKNLDTYLFVSVRNEVTRYKKRIGRFGHVLLDELPPRSNVTQEESPEDEIVRGEMEHLLETIIDTLPERCRLVFLLARREGLKPREIAERLSISENTVRVQMKIAIEKIIVRLKPLYPDLTFLILWSLLFSRI